MPALGRDTKPIALPGGIRPYESLWSVVNRFLWLHKPGIEELIQTFSILRPSWPDLLTGSSQWSVRPEARNRFLHPVLGLSTQQLDIGLLPPQLRSSGQLIYCRACAGGGYHSVVFQLPGITECPVHAEPLLSECTSCRSPIGTHLSPESVLRPYSCQDCNTSLIWSRTAFFRGDMPGPNEGLKRLHGWLQALTEEAVAWGDLRTAYHSRIQLPNPNENVCLLYALTKSCKKRTPTGIELAQSGMTRRASHHLPFSATVRPGIRSAATCPAPVGRELSVRLYRAYLKSLRQRYLSTAFQTALRKKKFSVWSEATQRRFPLEVAAAYAILLFRFRCEGWPTAHSLQQNPARHLLYNNVRSRDFHRGYTLIMPRSSPDLQEDDVQVAFASLPAPAREWTVAHWQMTEYRCLFAEALLFARNQMGAGVFDFTPRLEGRLIPAFFILTKDADAKSYRLDFWGRPQTDPGFYRKWGQAAKAKKAYYSRLVDNLR